MMGNVFRCNERTVAVRVIARDLGIEERRVVEEIRKGVGRVPFLVRVRSEFANTLSYFKGNKKEED